MKAASRAQYTLTLANPDELTDAIKKEFGDGSCYLWAKLVRPHRQDRQEFPYLVAPFKITIENKLVQDGAGVLCQTEAETKETIENLVSRSKKHLVSMLWAGGGVVGWTTSFRRYASEIGVMSKTLPNGEDLWVAFEREVDQDTLEVTVIRTKKSNAKGEVQFWANKWLEERSQKKKVYFDSVLKNVTPPPPPRCTALTQSDIQDLGNAKLTALKKQWPRCFGIFERQKSNPRVIIPDLEVEDAYLLDMVANGGESSLIAAEGGKVRADIKLISALHKAAQSYSKQGKSKIIETAIYLIAFNWELGWCYFSDEELAQKLSEILEIKFTAGQVKKYRSRTLGLVGKHLPGPVPKSP